MTLGESINIGVPNLTAAIDTVPEQAVEGRGRQGASGALTDPDEISFIVVEDSSRQELIKQAKHSTTFDYTYQPNPRQAPGFVA